MSKHRVTTVFRATVVVTDMALSSETDRIQRVSPRRRLRSAFLGGFAMTIPLIVTVLGVGFAVNGLTSIVTPLVGLVESAFGTGQLPVIMTDALVVATLAVTLGIGLVAEQNLAGSSVVTTVTRVVARISGTGSVYRSCDEMVTLSLPIAPTPVVGGHVVHVSADRGFDVNPSVEEGVQSIPSSGVVIEKMDDTSDAVVEGE